MTRAGGSESSSACYESGRYRFPALGFRLSVSGFRSPASGAAALPALQEKATLRRSVRSPASSFLVGDTRRGVALRPGWNTTGTAGHSMGSPPSVHDEGAVRSRFARSPSQPRQGPEGRGVAKAGARSPPGGPSTTCCLAAWRPLAMGEGVLTRLSEPIGQAMGRAPNDALLNIGVSARDNSIFFF